MDLKEPKNQTAEALYLLIQAAEMETEPMVNKRTGLSRMDFFIMSHILNAPAIISVLRNKYYLAIHTKEIEHKNKFGRKTSYCEYVLVSSVRYSTILYNKINQ